MPELDAFQDYTEPFINKLRSGLLLLPKTSNKTQKLNIAMQLDKQAHMASAVRDVLLSFNED